MSELIHIPAFTKTYNGVPATDVPALELERGKITAVIGPNGSGKSTFAKVIAGLEKADKPCEMDAVAGYLPQKSFPFRMSVRKNVMLLSDDAELAEHYMDALILTPLAGKPAHKLSGGETAKMAFARIMMRTFDVLILDEPTAAFDMKSAQAAEGLMREYAERTGAALVLITHSLAEARRVADNAIFFDSGHIAETGAASKVLYAPESAEALEFIKFYGE